MYLLPCPCGPGPGARARADGVHQHLQGQVVSLGVLKTSRDWYNSAVVLALAAAGAVCFVVVSKASQTQAESRRKAAVRDLGLE